ncbi:MAG: hypothetical protein RI924_109 [Bacteroidota bacterium]
MASISGLFVWAFAAKETLNSKTMINFFIMEYTKKSPELIEAFCLTHLELFLDVGYVAFKFLIGINEVFHRLAGINNG